MKAPPGLSLEFYTERGAGVLPSATGSSSSKTPGSSSRAQRLGPQYVKNGMLGTVVSTGDTHGGPLLSVRLDNGRDVIISEDSYRNVDHGYVATIHKSQGATVDRHSCSQPG